MDNTEKLLRQKEEEVHMLIIVIIFTLFLNHNGFSAVLHFSSNQIFKLYLCKLHFWAWLTLSFPVRFGLLSINTVIIARCWATT